MLKDSALPFAHSLARPQDVLLLPQAPPLALCLRRASQAPVMPLYTPTPMPPPLPPPLPRTPLLERTINKAASARGESAPIRVNNGDFYKIRQLVNEQVNVAIRQQQRYYHQYHYRSWTQPMVACGRQNPAKKAPTVPSPEESDKENQRPEGNTARALANLRPEQANRSALIKNRTPRTAPAPVSWPAPRRASCDEEDPHRSIWSISPYELGLMMVEALREERLKTKKISPPAIVGPVVAFGGPAGVIEKAANEEASLPSFRKYYSLPHMGKLTVKVLPRYMKIVVYCCASNADSNLYSFFHVAFTVKSQVA